jgi:hypothetical protein
MAEAEENLTLRVELGSMDFVHQFTDVLIDLDRAYNGVCYFLDLSRDIEDFHSRWIPYLPWPHAVAWFPLQARMRGRSSWRRRVPVVVAGVEDLSTFVLPNERLVLKGCQINSPGWMDILGKLNPLRILAQILRDYHEIRKDREYREEAEKERLRLENELLKNQVVRERIEILRQCGVSRSSIRQIFNSVLKEPINALQAHVDNGNIRDLRELLPPRR